MISQADLASIIRTIPDYPKKGILFRDVTTLMLDAAGFARSIELLAQPYANGTVDLVAGIEARGFIFGAAVAHALGVGFVPIRKKGKLPYDTISQEYALEYGTDVIELHRDALQAGHKVLLIDDLIATGGTALAAASLIERCGAEVVAAAFVVDLPDLGGAQLLRDRGLQVQALVSFDGH